MKTKKPLSKLTAWTLTLALLLALCVIPGGISQIAYAQEPAIEPVPITPVMPINPFEDVFGTDWFIDAVIYVYANELMTGTSTDPMLFSPRSTLTRSMVVTVLYRHEGSPDMSGAANPFTDVADGRWYTEAVKWAAANGIVGGHGDGRYAPNDDITREQMMTILHNYSKWKGIDVSVGEDTNILSYEDAFDISQYAIPAIQWACGAGIMGGDDNYLYPGEGATRAEFAAILMRFMQWAQQEE